MDDRRLDVDKVNVVDLYVASLYVPTLSGPRDSGELKHIFMWQVYMCHHGRTCRESSAKHPKLKKEDTVSNRVKDQVCHVHEHMGPNMHRE